MRPTDYLRKLLARRALSQDVSRRSGSRVKLFDRPMRDRMILEVERNAKGFDVYTDCERLANKPLFMERAPAVLALLRRPGCIPSKTTVFIGDGVTAEETAQKPMIAFCASRAQYSGAARRIRGVDRAASVAPR
jgi:hypothetical protein